MALSGSTVFNVRPSGSDTQASGGFVTGASGTDYSLQDAFQFDITTVSVVHSTTTQVNIHVSDWTIDATWVGNLLNITAGTATAGLYEIVSVDIPNNRLQLDRSAGTAGQTVEGYIGGAFATPGKAAAVMTVDQQRAYVKSGTYTITTTTPGAAGPVLLASNVTCYMEGYGTTQGDLGTAPTLNAGAQTGVNLFASQGTAGSQAFINLKADGNSQASIVGFNLTATNRALAQFCIAINCVTGFSGSRSLTRSCLASTCSGTGFVDCQATLCVAHACANGFSNSLVALRISRCLAYLCTTDGFVTSNNLIALDNCTADENGRYGFNFAGLDGGSASNCLATNHSGASDAGFFTSATGEINLDYCAGYNNTTNASGTYQRNVGFVTLSADPYVNRGSADFRPNGSAGGGALLRAEGIAVYGQTNSLDIGAVQATPAPHARFILGV
jgi:hypothetical protein